MSTNDGTLFRTDKPNGEYDYEVFSDADTNAPQPHEAPPSEYSKLHLSMPADLKARLRKIAEPVVAHVEARSRDGRRGPCPCLAAFLRDSGEFQLHAADDVRSIPASIRSKTSWSIARRVTANTSPAHLRFSCVPSTSPPESSTASREATGMS